MRNHLEALVPIFIDIEGERFSLFGSGVLIEFRGEAFLLTAGHVIDGFERGALMVPHYDNKIVEIDGSYSYIDPSDGRNSDNLDFGYFKLEKSFDEGMKKLFYAIPESEFGIKGDYSDKELMTFGGFPIRKHNVAGSVATTKEYAYGAYHAAASDYATLRCKPRLNIVAKYNRNKTVDTSIGKIQSAPLPHGISGGGIFIWPPVLKDLIPDDRKLIGIGHTYLKNGGYFIGTRLEIILTAILKNNPHLAIQI